MSRLFYLFVFLSLSLNLYAASPSASNARLYIISPVDGETVTSPVIVRFGLSNMGVAPAGVKKENTGHHHLLLDTDLPSLDQPLPSDGQHLHFGNGQTETELNLSPGKHTLQLILGDHAHIPHEPAVISEKISITVE